MSKADPRLAAMGDVDEANSAIGMAIAALPAGPVADLLASIQNDLFDLGADFATPLDGDQSYALRIVPPQIDRLEAAIDALNADIPPLTSFILPGGSPGAAALHLARAIARRAERTAVATSSSTPLNPQALTYLNRLSDLLFVAARAVNGNGAADVLWVPGASR